MNDHLRSRALSCSTCGAPLDLQHVAGDAVVCTACGARDSLVGRGVTRIRSYRIPVDVAVAETALRQKLAYSGLQLIAVQAREEAFPFLARLAQMRVFLSATESVVGTRDAWAEDVYRSLDLLFDGPMALREDDRAPVPWFALPSIDNLVFAGETALTNVELTLKNFDERLRIELTADIEREAGTRRWATTAVNITGSTHGELLEIWASVVWLRFQVATPAFGWALDSVSEDGWFSVGYAADGRFVGYVPQRRRTLAVKAVAIALGLVVFLLLAVLAITIAVLAPDGVRHSRNSDDHKNQEALLVSQEGPSDLLTFS